jgi:hypothetical protein
MCWGEDGKHQVESPVLVEVEGGECELGVIRQMFHGSACLCSVRQIYYD